MESIINELARKDNFTNDILKSGMLMRTKRENVEEW